MLMPRIETGLLALELRDRSTTPLPVTPDTRLSMFLYTGMQTLARKYFILYAIAQ